MNGDPAMNGIFIDVEVSNSARGDAELARRLEEACPVDIFAARDERGADRPREPGRVRAL